MYNEQSNEKYTFLMLFQICLGMNAQIFRDRNAYRSRTDEQLESIIYRCKTGVPAL